MAFEPVRLTGCPPTLLYVPRGTGPVPLVLLGHGAHLSKDDPVMQLLAKGLARNVPAAVALMDCPGHGERRAAETTDELFEADIARRMASAENIAEVRDDWIAVEEAARAADARISGPTGYAGFSMGAMFGLMIAGELPSIVSCVFALGGLRHANSDNVLIRSGAAALGDREVLMLNMTRDEHFPIVGAIEVFETIPGPKRMAVYAGTHVDIPAEAIELAVGFLQRTLGVPDPA